MRSYSCLLSRPLKFDINSIEAKNYQLIRIPESQSILIIKSENQEELVRSAQVYEIIIDDVKRITNALESLRNDDPNTFPRISRITPRQDGSIEGTIQVEKIHRLVSSDLFVVEFLFRLDINRLYLIGSSDARDIVFDILNGLNGIENSITLVQLEKDYLVKTTLDRLRQQNNSNFIKKINMIFGVNGINYHNPVPLYKLDYE
jgi:hypothetical protein